MRSKAACLGPCPVPPRLSPVHKAMGQPQGLPASQGMLSALPCLFVFLFPSLPLFLFELPSCPRERGRGEGVPCLAGRAATM